MDDDRMETGSITALGDGWYYSTEINKRFRWGPRGEVIAEDGTVLAPPPFEKGDWVDPQGDVSDAEEDTLP